MSHSKSGTKTPGSGMLAIFTVAEEDLRGHSRQRHEDEFMLLLFHGVSKYSPSLTKT